jgi:hypothetical protein
MAVIVDVHVHLGYDESFDVDFRPEYIHQMFRDGLVDRAIIQPATAIFLDGARQQHDAVARMLGEYPGRAFGMANPNPHLPEEIYRAEILRCIRELGFIGIKLNSVAHAAPINGQAAQKVYRAAKEMDVPVMLHTGGGPDFATPLEAIKAARAYPEVRFVLAHSGSGSGSQSIVAAQTCPNIFLETSWCNVMFLEAAERQLGASRLLFGSDHFENIVVELAKHRAIGLSDEEVAMCLGGTATQVYRLG